MNHNMKRRARWLLAGLALGGVQVGGAQAQMAIVGDARGCFGEGCVPDDVFALSLKGVRLSYASRDSVDFAGTTSGGVLAVGGTGAAARGSFGVVSVGTRARATPVRAPFRLELSFVNPVSAAVVFEAALRGRIRVSRSGVARFDFDPAPGSAGLAGTLDGVEYFDPQTGASGTLAITAFGRSMRSGGAREIRGRFSAQAYPAAEATVTPEPVSLALLGTGLAGVAAVRRRRRTERGAS